MVGLKVWFNKNVVKPLADSLSSPRFFSKDWKDMNDKEKIWIWEEDWWMRKGIGDSHLSKVEGIFIQLGLAYTFLNINNWPVWLVVFAPFVIGFSWWLKVKVANYLDAKDLIALSAEPSNRRNKVFRELRAK